MIAFTSFLAASLLGIAFANPVALPNDDSVGHHLRHPGSGDEHGEDILDHARMKQLHVRVWRYESSDCSGPFQGTKLPECKRASLLPPPRACSQRLSNRVPVH